MQRHDCRAASSRPHRPTLLEAYPGRGTASPPPLCVATHTPDGILADLYQVFQEAPGAAPAGAATNRASPKPKAVASEGAPRQPHASEPSDSYTGIGADWSHELEPSAWDEMRAIAMKQGLARQRTESAKALASEGEGEGGEGEAALQRPRRALKPAKPKQLLAEGEQMTATQRRELKQALENSRTIRQMHWRPARLLKATPQATVGHTPDRYFECATEAGCMARGVASLPSA